jgi:GxxExxY protein
VSDSLLEINDISGAIVDAAIKVHRAPGPGLLESTYEACLAYELRSRSLSVSTQVELPVQYGDVILEVGYRIDLLVAELVIVELKSVDSIPSIHKAQLLSYLKLSGKKIGLLINFNVELLKHGITRLAV